MHYPMQYTKTSYNLDKLESEIRSGIDWGENHLEYMNASGNNLVLYFHQEPNQTQKDLIDSIMAAHVDDIPYKSIISAAMAFGQTIIIEFAAENVAMGITQDNMTKTVRDRTTAVTQALLTGSLYDAINELKTFPAENKDAKYITDSRLLAFLNKIEDYLGIIRSTSL